MDKELELLIDISDQSRHKLFLLKTMKQNTALAIAKYMYILYIVYEFLHVKIQFMKLNKLPLGQQCSPWLQHTPKKIKWIISLFIK